ncbi:MAG: AsmA family protein [Sulfurifustis sp.]
MNARRFVKYSLIGLGTLAVAVVIAIAVVVPSIDAERYRPFLEKKARAITGRDLHIGGRLRLRMTSHLAVVASDVRLSNVAWGSYPDFMLVERVDAELNLFALLNGVVRIERLYLHRPRLFLETDGAGNNNWTFKPEPRSDTALPWRVELVLNECSLADARVEFRHLRTKRRYSGSLTQVVADREDASAFRLDGDGTIEGKPLRLHAIVGSAGEVFELRSRFALTLEATVEAMTIVAHGTIENIVGLKGVDLQLSVNGDDLAVLVRDLGWDTPVIGRFEGAGRLTGSPPRFRLDDIRFNAGRKETVALTAAGEVRDIVRLNGAAFDVDVRADRTEYWALWLGEAAIWIPSARIAGRIVQRRAGFDMDRLALTLGRTSLFGRVRVELPGGLPKVSATIRAPTIDLSTIPTAKTTSFETSVARGLDSTERLNVEWMRRFDADLDLAADKIRLPKGQFLYRPSTHVRLRKGRLTLAPVRLQLSPESAPISARLIVQDAPLGIRATATIAAASLPLRDLLALVRSPAAMQGAATQIDVELRSAGRSPRELVGSLNGNAKLIVGPGRFPSSKVDFGASLLTQLLGVTQPKEGRHAELVCAAAYFPIRDGVVKMDRNLALQTSNVTIIASGIADLRNRVMDMYVYTRATEGLGIEAGKLTNMLKIQGSLSKPSVGINPKGVVEGGLSIGAALATGGASLLFEGLARTAAADGDPCGSALTASSAR